MNLTEALRILGIDADASPEDIKTAYREMAQILHPDRFAGNGKLQRRATEQFKNLQEAYDVAMGKRSAKAPSDAASASRAPGCRSSAASEEREIEARLAGIAAARVQLAAQRDAFGDERRNGLGFLVVGGIVALICSRRPAGLLFALAGLATAAAVWGAVQAVAAQRSVAALDARLADLADEQRRLSTRLAELRGE